MFGFTTRLLAVRVAPPLLEGEPSLCAIAHSQAMTSVIARLAEVLYSKNNDGVGGPAMKKFAGLLGGLIACTLLAAAQVQAGSDLEALVRTLAENILGEGQVTSVHTVDNEATVLIRWQSATHKPSNSLAVTRELLYAEAVLASNSVMGPVQQVSKIRFTIMRGDQMLATGQATRATGVSLMFAPELGGGRYQVPPSTPRPSLPGQDRTAQEQ